MSKKTKYMIIEEEESTVLQREVPFVFDFDSGVFVEGICKEYNSYQRVMQLIDTHGIDKICRLVVSKFKNYYGINLDEVKIITNMTRNTVNASFDPKSNVITIDRMFMDSLHNYFIICFLWEDYAYSNQQTPNEKEREKEDAKINEIFFKYLLSSYYSLIKESAPCDVLRFKKVWDKYLKIGENSIFNLIVACLYATVYFCVAHECAHAYFQQTNTEFKKTKELSAEFIEECAADKMAFKILVNMIQDETNSDIDIKDRELWDYAVFAPLMLLHFYIEYFMVCKRIEDASKKPNLKNCFSNAGLRWWHLLKFINKFDIPFDTKEAQLAYRSFLNSVESFDEIFQKLDDIGDLDIILDQLYEIKESHNDNI